MKIARKYKQKYKIKGGIEMSQTFVKSLTNNEFGRISSPFY